MLVLSRKKDERVRISDNIVVTVVDIRGDKVRLGFEAPSDVAINREEVWLAIAAEHQRNSKEAPNATRT